MGESGVVVDDGVASIRVFNRRVVVLPAGGQIVDACRGIGVARRAFEALYVWQAGEGGAQRMERHRIRGIALAATAAGYNHQLVVGVGVEAAYGTGIGVNIIGGDRPNVETGLADIDQPCVGIRYSVPCGIHAVECGACHPHALRCGATCGHPQQHVVEGEMIELTHCGVGWRRSLDDDIFPTAHIIVKGHRDMMKGVDGLVAEVDGIDRHEGGVGGDIGCYAHHHAAMGYRPERGIGAFYQEGEFQVGDIHRVVQSRQCCPSGVLNRSVSSSCKD